MELGPQLASQFRDIFLEGRWIANTNLRDQLSDLDWVQATTRVGRLNTIAELTFHLHYYVAGILQVLQGGTLDIRDRYSFDAPPIHTEADWAQRRQQLWRDAEHFATAVELMSNEDLTRSFADPQYGNYYRNIQGMIEHGYYHLGQIVLLRKLIDAGI